MKLLTVAQFARKMNVTPQAVYQKTVDEVINRAGEHADNAWKEKALQIVLDLCESRREFTTDDVHARLDLSGPTTKEGRALGAVLQNAAKNGWCQNTMQFVKSERPSCHRRPIPIWKSRLIP